MNIEKKDAIKALYNEWSAAKTHKAEVSAQMKEFVEAVADLLDADKKTATKLLSLMDKQDSKETYDVLNLYEEVMK
jgi:hypothetical protein